jgi:hypothetical protein
MVTNRASGSAHQADGTTQKKTRINRERSRRVWTETCNPVPQVDGVVRYSGRSEVNKNLGEKRVAVNGPYVSRFFDHDAVLSGPEPISRRRFIRAVPECLPHRRPAPQYRPRSASSLSWNPSILFCSVSGEGGTTSATGFPNRVIRSGFFVCRTRSSKARHFALNSEMATSSIGNPNDH